jgi:hypothetical protein
MTTKKTKSARQNFFIRPDRKSSHEVMLLSDLDDLHLREETHAFSSLLISEDNPWGRRAVFKYELPSISEVFGYLLARMLGVPIAHFQGVWFGKEVKVSGHYRVPANHLCILIEFVPNLRPISLEDLAGRQKALTAKLLTFYFFDRFEWPEIFESGTSLYVMDLERIGPVMAIDEFQGSCKKSIRQALLEREEQYLRSSQIAISEILENAESLHVQKELHKEVRRMSQIPGRMLWRGLSIKGHPYSALLSAFFLSVVSERQAIWSSQMAIKSWPPVDWESVIAWRHRG